MRTFLHFVFGFLFYLLVAQLTDPSFVIAQSCSPITPATQCSVENSVTINANVPESSVTFSGFAPIGSVVTIKEGGVVVGTAVTNSNGQFSRTVVSTPGTHSFNIYATDTSGLSTPEITLSNISVVNHNNTPVTNIHLPPTIGVSKSSFVEGTGVSISGQGPPGSTVHLYLNGKKIFTGLIGGNGLWQFQISEGYKIGQNVAYALLSRNGVSDSANSLLVVFQVSECKDGQCTLLPPTQEPAQPSEETSPKGQNYLIDLNIGFDLGNNIVLIMLISLLLTVLVTIFLLFWKRRKKKEKEEVLARLEEKVERDLHRPNPELRIEKDFWEAEREIE